MRLEHVLKMLMEKFSAIMSDMHRGDGTGSDDFARNSLIYKCALVEHPEGTGSTGQGGRAILRDAFPEFRF